MLTNNTTNITTTTNDTHINYPLKRALCRMLFVDCVTSSCVEWGFSFSFHGKN